MTGFFAMATTGLKLSFCEGFVGNDTNHQIPQLVIILFGSFQKTMNHFRISVIHLSSQRILGKLCEDVSGNFILVLQHQLL